MSFTVIKHIFTGEISVAIIHDGGGVFKTHWFRADNAEEINTFLKKNTIPLNYWDYTLGGTVVFDSLTDGFWSFAKAEKRYNELVKSATTTAINFV